jgi:superoxide dismutase, Fe-Mn family
MDMKPQTYNRRHALLGASAVGLASAYALNTAGFMKITAATAQAAMPLELPALPYAYDALAPYMSKETLEFHHDKHHLAAITAANKLLKDSSLAALSVEEICTKAFAEKDAGLGNSVCQHYNHLHFWNWMKPNGGGTKLPATIEKAVTADLGGYHKMRADFIQAGLAQFGSGWVWIAALDGKLAIVKTQNGENPVMHGAQPILGCDVWEHSYYIDYRNARQKYLEAFVDHLVNWDYVEAMHAMA